MDNTSHKELVSIIIPVYNLEKYIGDCLESVVNQDYRCLEIIVIDDGSTDNSKTIIKQWIDRDSRIKLISQDNAGVSVSRNRGVEVSTGEYIVFVDGDDWIDENCISVLLKNIQEDNSDIVKCAFTFLNPINDISRKRNVPNKVCTGKDAFKEFLCGYGWTSSVWGAMYMSSFLKGNNLQFIRNEKIGEDGIFTMRALLSANKVKSINISLYNIRFRSGSASRNKIIYSTEHKYVDRIDSSEENRLFRNAFKLRVLMSNLFRTAFQCSYSDFNVLYKKIYKEDNLRQLNDRHVRNFLPFRLNIIATLAKNKGLFFIILKLITYIGYKPLF